MKIRYVDDNIVEEPSIFLAGPTPRDYSFSWRTTALDILNTCGYEHTVYVPETFDRSKADWVKQVTWETHALEVSTVIAFWICRSEWKMPGLTTNDEWGYWKSRDPDKILLGVPPGSLHCRYQTWWALKLGIPSFNDIGELLGEAVKRVNCKAEEQDQFKCRSTVSSQTS